MQLFLLFLIKLFYFFSATVSNGHSEPSSPETEIDKAAPSGESTEKQKNKQTEESQVEASSQPSEFITIPQPSEVTSKKLPSFPCVNCLLISKAQP